MNTSEKLHKMIYAILCGDKDYTLHNLYALAWDAVIEDNGKDARIRELEAENAKFLRMIYARLHQAYQDQIVDTDMESIECGDGNIERFKSEWLATELEAWMQDETP